MAYFFLLDVWTPAKLNPINIEHIVKDEEREWFSGLWTRYRKALEKHKNIENKFYTNDSLNNYLKVDFRKAYGDPLFSYSLRPSLSARLWFKFCPGIMARLGLKVAQIVQH